MNQLVATLITLTVLVSTALACRPFIRLYESYGYGEDYIPVAFTYLGFEDNPNVTGYYFDYSYTCPEGVWLGYREANYSGLSYIISSYKNTVDGLNSCTYENTGKRYRSLRVLGSHADYTASAVVVFPNQYEDGEPRTYFNDTENLTSAPFDSLVLIGDVEVELFTRYGFAGLSVCVGPNNNYINDWSQFEEVNHLRNGTSRYTALTAVSNVFGNSDFQSFRFGCQNKNPMKFNQKQ